ncbi:MAG: hypothetical protein DRQ48_00880 [Gammaproteobacteria bacterium]|nr:MAG: hypothetical protein DRQ44_00490 [Gammaproteobacteria bacterium]RKZ72233.1 MAG: hypothetical protein DRQ48_00880 [Gammaproteobacteria bacterium]
MYSIKVDEYHVQKDGTDWKLILFQGSNPIDEMHFKSEDSAVQYGEKCVANGYDSNVIDPWHEGG